MYDIYIGKGIMKYNIVACLLSKTLLSTDLCKKKICKNITDWPSKFSQIPKRYIHINWRMGQDSYAFTVLQTCEHKFFSLTQNKAIGTDKIGNGLEKIEFAGGRADHSYCSFRLVEIITQFGG